MLGAWKQEADGSPFLAMRFEGGVFYITLESAQTRIMLGSTLVDARGFLQVVKEQGQKFGFITDSRPLPHRQWHPAQAWQGKVPARSAQWLG